MRRSSRRFQFWSCITTWRRRIIISPEYFIKRIPLFVKSDGQIWFRSLWRAGRHFNYSPSHPTHSSRCWLFLQKQFWKLTFRELFYRCFTIWPFLIIGALKLNTCTLLNNQVNNVSCELRMIWRKQKIRLFWLRFNRNLKQTDSVILDWNTLNTSMERFSYESYLNIYLQIWIELFIFFNIWTFWYKSLPNRSRIVSGLRQSGIYFLYGSISSHTISNQ